MVIDGEYHGGMTTGKVSPILKKYQSGSGEEIKIQVNVPTVGKA
jgi:hypothetical protein